MADAVPCNVRRYVESPKPWSQAFADAMFVPIWFLDLAIVLLFTIEVLVRFAAKK